MSNATVNIESAAPESPIPFGYSKADIERFEKTWAKDWETKPEFKPSDKTIARFFYCLGLYDAGEEPIR